ncbi:hypothetical protein [Mesorhizobium sp. 128a]
MYEADALVIAARGSAFRAMEERLQVVHHAGIIQAAMAERD